MTVDIDNINTSDNVRDDEKSVKPEQRMRRRRKRNPLHKALGKIKWTIVIGFIVVAIIVIGVTSAVLITDSMNRLDASQESLSRVLDTLNRKPADQWTYEDFERLQSSVNDMLRDLNRVNQRTALVRPMAGLNKDFETSLQTVQIAEELGLAVDQMLSGLQPTLFFITGEQKDSTVAEISSGERIVELLRLGRGSFVVANNHLATAQEKLDGLNRSTISSSDLLLRVEDLTEYQANIQEINTILLQSPELMTVAMGLDETQSYLVLSQNNDEIRPAGGYISTYGWMTVRNSRILDFQYQPTTPQSPNPPSDTLASEIPIPSWWIQYQEPIYTAWDASWYADFASTAQWASWYYDNGNNPQSPVDGVIGIDIVGLQYMLEALEQVVVPGYNEVVTPANFREVVYDIRASGEGDAPHKRFLAQLYRQMMADWQNVEGDKKSDVLGALLRGLREKHLMLYFKDEKLNEAVTVLGWGANQKIEASHDYLMVADANFSANKSNHSIARQVTYDVTIQDDGSLNNRLTIGYDYSDAVAKNDPAVQPEHYNSIDYFNIMQIYVPKDSIFVSSDEEQPFSVETTDTYTEFITNVIVEYNSGERIQLSYETPVIVEEFGSYRRYKLLVQKQPGSHADPVSVQISLPKSASVIRTSPEPAAQFTLDQPILEFRFTLERDQWVEIIYKQ